jgi:hypothetical protein
MKFFVVSFWPFFDTYILNGKNCEKTILRKKEDQAMKNLITEQFHNTPQAAGILQMSERTLEKWRVIGGGPVYRKFGRKVLYAHSDLLAWIESARKNSTSEYA